MKKKNKKAYLLLLLILIFLAALPFATFWENKDKAKEKVKKIQTVKQYSFINVNDMGAMGDGKHDDTKAILKAINLVKNGGNLIFDSNKTYLITDTILVTKDITFTTNGQKNATILMSGNNAKKPVLYFKGRIKNTFPAKSSLLTRDIRLQLPPDIKNVESDDLLLVESNTPWYFEPRTGTENLHKGELHRIIGFSQSSVILAEGLWDTYDSKTEDIQIKLIDPIKVNLQKINVVRSPSHNRTVGIKLEYGVNSSINKVNVKNSTAVGIHVVSSYSTNIEDSFITEANDKYSGYGIQSYGSSYSTIKDNRITGSRRGIDVSGSYPDYYSTVEFNNVFGGGKNELGLNYLTEDTQYGVGTHSTANYTVFRGNVVANLNYGINIRSANVTIKQNKFLGYFKGASIILAYGRNASIIDNETISGNNIPQFALQNDLPKNIKNFNAKTFLTIKGSYELNNSTLLINGNKALDVSGEFIKFLNIKGMKNSQIKNLQVSDNEIRQTKRKNGEPFYFINSDFPIKASINQFNNNKLLDSSMKQQKIVSKNFISSLYQRNPG